MLKHKIYMYQKVHILKLNSSMSYHNMNILKYTHTTRKCYQHLNIDNIKYMF